MGRVSDYLNANIGAEGPQRVGIGGFTALARVRQKFTYESEVPTTYLEDGSSVEDHLVLKPVKLSIEGEVSDIFVEQTPIQSLTQNVATSIGSISAYLPERTQQQQQAVSSVVADINSAINRADELIDAGENVAQLFGAANAEGKTITESFIDTMEALHLGRQLVQIEMHYRTFDNMRITKFDVIEDNKKKAVSFSVEAVEVRTAEKAVSDVSSLIKNPSNGLGGQAQEQTDKGVQKGAPTETSLLGTLLGLGG